MTVNVNDTIERYTVSGVGPYPFSFRIFADTDLQVTACSTATPPVSTILTYLTHYTVTGANVQSGGSITLTAGAATTYAGYTLDIRSNTPETQPTSIRNIGRFLPEIHEDAYDNLSRQIQDLRRMVNACVRYPDNTLNDGALSPIQSWVSKYLTIGPTGLLEPSILTSSGSLTQSIIANLLYPRTAAEIAGGIVPSNLAYPTGYGLRYTLATTIPTYISGMPDGSLAGFVNTRTITTTADYGFLDNATVAFSGAGIIGHASFATRVNYASTFNDDHHHDFQARSAFNGSATLTETTGFWVQSEINSGTITEMSLFRGLNPLKTGGTLNTLYGLYLSELNQGSVANFAIWTDGPTPSRFGRILVGSGTHVDSSDISISDDATPGLAWYCTTAGSNLKLWDIYADTAGALHFRHVSDDTNFNSDWCKVEATGNVSEVGKITLTANQIVHPKSANNCYLFGNSATILTGTLAQFQAPASVGGIAVKVVSNNFAVHYVWNADTTGNNIFCDFGTEGTYTSRGSIDYNRGGTAVRYNTTSDERLKTNIVSAPSAGALIDAIQVRSFDWKESGHHVVHGFIAQELNTVAPEAVSEGNDTRSWGVDPSKLVPMLVKEIQDLRRRVAALEA